MSKQKYFEGDLVMITKDKWPYLKSGDIGIITYADCREVCVKSGLKGRSVANGGPRFTMEWVYVLRLHKSPRGVRMSNITQAEVICAAR